MADKNNITRIGGDMHFDIPPTPPFVRPRYPSEYQSNATDGQDGYTTAKREPRQGDKTQFTGVGSVRNRANKGGNARGGSDLPSGLSREQNQSNNSGHGDGRYSGNGNNDRRNHNNQNHKPFVSDDTKKEPRGKFPFGGNLLRLLNFKNFDLGSDSILIIVLILLLSKEGTDEYLLMALVYIMM